MSAGAGFHFYNPVAVTFGRGAAARTFEGLPRPLLCVAGKQTLERSGLAAAVGADPEIHAFPEIPPNPGPDAIDAGARLAEARAVRSVVGVGGGSALDAAKCIAVLVGNAAGVAEFQQRCAAGEDFERRVKLVQVPTTAGTGSEVTRWASVWDAEGRKSSMDAPGGYADVAIVDPTLSDSMSPRLTAITGLDAFSHAVESIWGRHANPVSDAFAAASLARSAAHLLPALEAPAPAHRDALCEAALLAGQALSNCRSAAAHALSYGLTGRYGVEHGLAVGLLSRALLPWNERHAPERLALIRASLGMTRNEEIEAFVDAVCAAAGITPRLGALGVPAEALAELAREASETDRLANNPGRFASEDLLAVLERIA